MAGGITQRRQGESKLMFRERKSSANFNETSIPSLTILQNLNVYLIGHQPLTTKKGKDEYDPDASHFTSLKALLAKYSSIIKIGLFGHRNIAG